MPFEFLMRAMKQDQDKGAESPDAGKGLGNSPSQLKQPRKRPLTDDEERALYESRELPEAAPFQEPPQASPPSQAVTPQPKLTEAPGGVDTGFLKERSKARDFAFKEAEHAIDQALSEIDTRDPGAGNPTDREPFRTRLRASSPENYAREVESILNELEPTVQGLGGAFDRKRILGNLEEAVTNYKRLQARPEAVASDRNLDVKDLPMLQRDYEAKQRSIREIDEKLKFTATRRQEADLRSMKSYIEKGAATVRQRIEKIKPGATMDQNAAGDDANDLTTPRPPSPDNDILKHANAAGRSPEQLKLSIVAMMEQLEGKGVDIEDLQSSTPFNSAMLKAFGIVDPQGVALTKLTEQMRADRARELEAIESGNDLLIQEIRAKQAQRKALFGGVGKDPDNQNWLSAIAFVLMSVLVGPEGAARIFFGARREGSLKYQLSSINQEIREDMSILRMRKEDERRIRQEAASRLSRQTDRLEDRAHDFNLIAARAKASAKGAEKRTKSQEEKEVISNLRRDLEMYQGRVNEYEQELERLSNMNLSDPYGLGRGKEADATRKLRRDSLLHNINVYRAKTERLAEIIEKLTGTSQLLEPAEGRE